MIFLDFMFGQHFLKYLQIIVVLFYIKFILTAHFQSLICLQPLRIECGQKLIMVDEETGLIGPDRLTPLYRMKHADDKKVKLKSGIILIYQLFIKFQNKTQKIYSRSRLFPEFRMWVQFHRIQWRNQDLLNVKYGTMDVSVEERQKIFWELR